MAIVVDRQWLVSIRVADGDRSELVSADNGRVSSKRFSRIDQQFGISGAPHRPHPIYRRRCKVCRAENLPRGLQISRKPAISDKDQSASVWCRQHGFGRSKFVSDGRLARGPCRHQGGPRQRRVEVARHFWRAAWRTGRRYPGRRPDWPVA